MSEGQATLPPVDDKCQTAEKTLVELLRLMDFPLRVEVKDGPDGGIAVALHPEGTLAGFTEGKRSPVLESLQFLVNKIVNPPPGPRRWVTIGVGGFPPPRSASPAPRTQAPPPPPRAAPVAETSPAPAPVARPGPLDEAQISVEPDAVLSAVGKTLAEKSASLGRFYAVLGLSMEDRARLLQAAQPVAGVTVSAEGEGRHRRLVYRPDKPAPVPKRVPDDEDE